MLNDLFFQLKSHSVQILLGVVILFCQVPTYASFDSNTEKVKMRTEKNYRAENHSSQALTQNTDKTKIASTDSILPMLGGLMGVLLVIWVVAFALKKFSRLNPVDSHIKVIDTQSLGTKEKLIIIEVQKRQFLLGVTAHSINKICELDERITRRESRVSFDSMMKLFLNSKNRSNLSQGLKND